MVRLLLLMALSVALGAQAAEPVKRLYVFGDSYSDSGRGYLDSNGPTAVVYLARRLGFDLLPSNAANAKGKSLNFAVSGAGTGEGKGFPVEGGLLGVGMKNQVDEFLELKRSGVVSFDPKSTVFFIAGGLNDGRFKTEYTVQNLETEMLALYVAGARRFRVAILPEKVTGFDEVSKRLNPTLAQIPAEMRTKMSGAEIESSRWGPFFDEVSMHPAKYGITDTTNACAGRVINHQDPTPCASPETHFYYHADHPSTATAKSVGDMLYDELAGQR